MVIGISKRHQFRNERALQDLIRTVPGNDRCADCHTANPGGLILSIMMAYTNGVFLRLGKLECTLLYDTWIPFEY